MAIKIDPQYLAELLRYAVSCRNQCIPIGAGFDEWYSWHTSAQQYAALIIAETC